MRFQRSLSLVSIIVLGLTAWAASHSDNIPKEKPCEGDIQYTIENTEITYRLVGDFCFVGTSREDRAKNIDVQYSTGSTGLFYVWDRNFAHAIAFLPIKSKPFPHPLPSEPKGNEYYLHLTNGENLIMNTQTGKVDWEKSFRLGLTSAKINEVKPNKNGHMINIGGYQKNQLIIDFASSAAGDPFIKKGSKGKIYKYLDNETAPRTCIVENQIFLG